MSGATSGSGPDDAEVKTDIRRDMDADRPLGPTEREELFRIRRIYYRLETPIAVLVEATMVLEISLDEMDKISTWLLRQVVEMSRGLDRVFHGADPGPDGFGLD